jgi:hypothetical protein
LRLIPRRPERRLLIVAGWVFLLVIGLRFARYSC